jgi:hypothetical protein
LNLTFGDKIHHLALEKIIMRFSVGKILTAFKSFIFQAQLVLLVVLVVAIVDFFVGTFIPPTEDKLSKGFEGYSGEINNFMRA